MGNSRSFKRKISGKSGRSPGKSRRRQEKRQRAIWQIQAATKRMADQGASLLESLGEKDVEEQDQD